MGKRRIRNLQTLKTEEIVGFDTREDRRREVVDMYGIKVADSVDVALKEDPDGMVICTPPDMHKEHALIAIKKGIPFFTEVNTMSAEDMQEIIDMCKESNVNGMPSCNLLFHPSVKRMKKVLEEGKIGRLLTFRLHVGSYLPDWHPWEKMSDYYVYRKETGGGRDGIMWELNWILSILGMPRTVFASVKKLGSYDAEIFDMYDLHLELDGGVLGNIVMDLIQRTPSRYCEMIGTNGTLRWNHDDRAVRYWNTDGEKWVTYLEKDDCGEYPEEKVGPRLTGRDAAMVESYVKEMEVFMNMIRGSIPALTFEDEKIHLKTMFEAEASSEEGIKKHIS